MRLVLYSAHFTEEEMEAQEFNQSWDVHIGIWLQGLYPHYFANPP